MLIKYSINLNTTPRSDAITNISFKEQKIRTNLLEVFLV